MSFLSAYNTAYDTATSVKKQKLLEARDRLADQTGAAQRLERLRQAEVARRTPPDDMEEAPEGYAAPPPKAEAPAPAPAGTGKVIAPVSKPGVMGDPSLLPNQNDNELAKLVRQQRVPGNVDPRAVAKTPSPESVRRNNSPQEQKRRLDELRQVNPPGEGVGVTPLYGGNSTDAAAIQRLKEADARIRATPRPAAGGTNQYDAPTQYDTLIAQAARQAGIDPAMFKRLIGSESSFNPTAASPRGAQYGLGIAQIAASHGLTDAQRLDPNVALPFAAQLFAKYLKAAGGDVREAVLRYKGAVSEQGRAAMGAVYDRDIAGGQQPAGPAPAPQAPGVQTAQAPAPAPAAPQYTGPRYTDEQVGRQIQQGYQRAAWQMQQLRDMAQVTSDPVKLLELQGQYLTLQAGVREAKLYEAFSRGQLSPDQYRMLSLQEKQRVAAEAAEYQKARIKAQGEAYVESVKGSEARATEELKGQQAIYKAIQERLLSADDIKNVNIDRNSGKVIVNTARGVFEAVTPDLGNGVKGVPRLVPYVSSTTQ